MNSSAAAPSSAPPSSPAQAHVPSPATSSDSASPLGSAHRVLFVENHGPTRTALATLLRRQGYEVTVAESVTEAVRLARDHTFDVLVTDLGLPDGDGCMLLRELRKRQPGLAGIVVSGHGLDRDIERTRSAGFAEHLTKPVSVDALKQAFARLLGK